MTKKNILYVAALFLVGTGAIAVTFNDPLNLVQNTLSAISSNISNSNEWDIKVNQQKLISEQIKEYEQMIREYEVMIDQAKSLTGKSDYGSFLNTVESAIERRYTPQTLGETRDLASYQGMNSEATLIARKVDQTYPIDDLSGQDANALENKQFREEADTVNAVSSISEHSFNRLENQIKEMEKLTQEISATEDLKRSADLNSRIQSQAAFVNLELLRVVSLQTKMLALEKQRNLQSEQESAKFNVYNPYPGTRE